MNKFKGKPLKEGQIFYIFLGAGLIVLIIFFIIFFPRNPKIEARLASIEERLLNLEGGERILRIEDKLSNLEKSVPLRLDNIEKKLGTPHIKVDADQGVKKAATVETLSAPKKGTETKPDNIKEKISAESKPKNLPEAEPANDVKKITKAQYHEIRSGDNLYNLSRIYNVKLEDLQKLNNITPGTILQPGQKILINP